VAGFFPRNVFSEIYGRLMKVAFLFSPPFLMPDLEKEQA